MYACWLCILEYTSQSAIVDSEFCTVQLELLLINHFLENTVRYLCLHTRMLNDRSVYQWWLKTVLRESVNGQLEVGSRIQLAGPGLNLFTVPQYATAVQNKVGIKWYDLPNNLAEYQSYSLVHGVLEFTCAFLKGS